ncbi:aminodeoxychorismate/anthranilate synthase component II, partial [Staphylococcus aureus]
YYPVHGHTTQLRHTNECIFQRLPQNSNVMRYHSINADGATFPNCLKITAKNDEAIIMAVEHITCPFFGVQYHPVSTLSEYGYRQVELFLSKVGDYCEKR